IVNSANDVFLSVACIWELAIKISNKRLTISERLDLYVDKWAHAYRLDRLPVKSLHALAVARLPPHHKDPFDRILVAQAITEGMTLVTSDRAFAAYGVPVLW